MKKSYLLIALAFVALFWTSCEPTEPIAQTAPEIPPQEIFGMPTEEVTTMTADTTSNPNTTGRPTYRNVFYAGVNLAIWHTVAVLHTAIPVAAFGTALNERPVYIGNATFEWSYQYVAPAGLGGKTYDVSLTGQYINNSQDVKWTMTVSEVGGPQNFVWYDGIVSVDHTSATFTVYRNPANPEPYLRLDYSGNQTNPDHSLRYTNVAPNDPGKGGYIEYRVQSTQSYNRAFDVTTDPNDPTKLLEIQWVEPTGEGRVKNEAHYGDTDWHCWDIYHADTAC